MQPSDNEGYVGETRLQMCRFSNLYAPEQVVGPLWKNQVDLQFVLILA